MLSENQLSEALNYRGPTVPRYSLSVGADGLVPPLIDTDDEDEALYLLDSVLSRIEGKTLVIIQDLRNERSYRDRCLPVRRLVRARTIFDRMV